LWYEGQEFMEEQQVKKRLPIGAIFRHYKGKEYRILFIGRHSEDLSLYVVYQGLYNCQTFGPEPIWVRPAHLFFETVTVQGKEVPRFVEKT
jgi:cyclomaltodextrinase